MFPSLAVPFAAHKLQSKLPCRCLSTAATPGTALLCNPMQRSRTLPPFQLPPQPQRVPQLLQPARCPLAPAALRSPVGISCLAARRLRTSRVRTPSTSTLHLSASASPSPPPQTLTSLTSTSSALTLGFEDRVSEFTLPNGMHFIVMERHDAPVLSCMMHANVGAYDEDEGSTGLAHLLEHMAFKGTSEVGTRGWAREGPLLQALDEAFYELRVAKQEAAARGADPAGDRRVANLDARFKQLQAEAAALSVPNAFGSALQQEGAVGLNATTSQDETKYFVSLPSNKLELWFALEARRFQDPVFRELYSEKRVIEEERRLRVDSSPMGRYQQQFALSALSNHYRRPVIGFAEDVERMGRREVFNFFNRYYGPGNLTVAIVGDAEPERVRRLAELYFGGWDPAGRYEVLPSGAALASRVASEPLPYPASDRQGQYSPADAVPPVPAASRLYRAASDAGPLCLLGFYRPALTTPDGVTLKVLSDVLASGRTSRLVSRLVLGERSLLQASADAAMAGDKHAGLALVYGRPAEGGTPETAERVLRRELDRFMDKGPDAAELERVKKGMKVGVYSTLQSNRGMADALATYHVVTGSWRGVVTEVQAVSELGIEQSREVARRVFAERNCFRGYVDSIPGASRA